jgi:hypothetical protein
MGTPTRLSVAATAAILAACATPYKPESALYGGGFSEQRRAPGVYAVWFAGNVYTTEDRSEELAVLRAAELCLGEGKAFMRTSDFQTGTALSGYTPTTPIKSLTPVVPTTAKPTSPIPTTVGYMPGRALYTTKSALKVECLLQKGEDAQDAAAVASSFRERYGLRRLSADSNSPAAPAENETKTSDEQRR